MKAMCGNGYHFTDDGETLCACRLAKRRSLRMVLFMLALQFAVVFAGVGLIILVLPPGPWRTGLSAGWGGGSSLVLSMVARRAGW